MSEIKSIVLNLIKGATPERTDELKTLWDKYEISFGVVQDDIGVRMGEKDARVRFTAKTIDVYWLIGFSAWKTLECYSGAIYSGLLLSKTIDECLSSDRELHQFEQPHIDNLSAARRLLNAPNRDSSYWPEGIPKPTNDRESFASIQEVVAYDLTAIATAYIFLHEVRHCIYTEAGDRPSLRAQEELDCDIWAREFLTSKIHLYAESTSQSPLRVRRKRAMGMAIAALIIHELTPEHNLIDTPDYYGITTRLDAIVGNMELPDHDTFWLFIGTILISIFRTRKIEIDYSPQSPKDLTEFLLSRLKSTLNF